MKWPKYGFGALSSELGDEFGQILHWEKGKGWVDFRDLDLILKVTPAVLHVQNRVFCALSFEPVYGFEPNLPRYINGSKKRVD